jgi:hypothetical protein
MNIFRIAKKMRGDHIKMSSTPIAEWTQEVELLKRELRERMKSLPAHSIRLHQLLAIEELEERTQILQDKLSRTGENSQERK